MHLKSDVSRNVAAIFIGLFIAIISAILIDRTFAWSMNIKVSRSNFFAKSDDLDGLGWSARNERKLKKTDSGYSVNQKEVFDDNVVFDVTYNFDSLYRRRVQEIPLENTGNFAIFFGDSQTFGEGLNDKDTIPAIFQTNTSSYRVYNYAYKGYGPHQMLKKLETHSLSNEIAEKKGVAFFQYFDFHMQRVIGSMSYISWAGGGAPYYGISAEDQLEYLGSFATGRFFRTLLYWLLSKSAIANYYQVDLPKQITQQHFDLFCRVLEKSRSIFLAQYPGSRFVVIVGMTNSETDTIIQECLTKNDIEYIDMRGLDKNAQGLQFPHNGHFTPKASLLIAQQLIPLIGK